MRTIPRLVAPLLYPLLLLPLSAAWADTDQHAISPSMLQDQQQAIQREQARVEREAGGEALAEKRGELIRNCQTGVGRKSLFPGHVSFDSVNIIEEKRVYITGRVNFPDAQGRTKAWHYECTLDADKNAIADINVSAVH